MVKTHRRSRRTHNQTKRQRKVRIPIKYRKESKSIKYARLKKIREALIGSMGWFNQNRSCDSRGDLYVAYPYDDQRTCLKLSIHKPIPFDTYKRFKYVKRYLGEPLGFTYTIGKSPARFDG